MRDEKFERPAYDDALALAAQEDDVDEFEGEVDEDHRTGLQRHLCRKTDCSQVASARASGRVPD
jgi:hypothetical protein